MKFAAYLLLAVFILSMVMIPFSEMMFEFTDKIKVDSAATTAGRAATMGSASGLTIRDAESAMKFYDQSNNANEAEKGFIHKFVDAFCVSLDVDVSVGAAEVSYLDDGLPEKSITVYPNSSSAQRFSEFVITFTPVTKELNAVNVIYKCKVEIVTAYKFKTKLLRYIPSNKIFLKVKNKTFELKNAIAG